MSSLFFEREQIQCGCFQSSPVKLNKVFKTDFNNMIYSCKKQQNLASQRNFSQKAKKNKKSLKKQKPQRPFSATASEKDLQQKEDKKTLLLIEEIQPVVGFSQIKKQSKLINPIKYQSIIPLQINKEGTRLLNNFRSQHHHALYEPIHFQTMNFDYTQSKPIQIYSESKIKEVECDKKATKEFQKDLTHLKLKIKIENFLNEQKDKLSNKLRQNQKPFASGLNINAEKESNTNIKFPLTSQTISMIQNQKLENKVFSLTNSPMSNWQKTSIHRIFPKLIQSQKGSETFSDQDKESVFLGRDFGFTENRKSIELNLKSTQQGKQRIETMITQQSHIKNSQIQTAVEWSHIMNSPKSLHRKGITFGGGGQNKYELGMSFQNIKDIRRPKLNSSTKFQL